MILPRDRLGHTYAAYVLTAAQLVAPVPSYLGLNSITLPGLSSLRLGRLPKQP